MSEVRQEVSTIMGLVRPAPRSRGGTGIRAGRVLVFTAATAAAMAVIARRAYRQVRDWGAEADDLVRELPGDDLVADAEFRRTRAINIDADRATVWRWLVRSGRPLGWLRGRWLGQFDGLALVVAVVRPPRVLVLKERATGWWDVSWAFMIIARPAGHCRLLVRTRARARPGWIGRLWLRLFRMLDPVTVALTRRMLLDIKYRAEAERLVRAAS